MIDPDTGNYLSEDYAFCQASLALELRTCRAEPGGKAEAMPHGLLERNHDT